MGLDAGQHTSRSNLILNVASSGKDIGKRIDRGGVNLSRMTGGKSQSFPIVRFCRALP
jgi:hypothetical protein